jgi:sodium pump decarboxylase gamma subunit
MGNITEGLQVTVIGVLTVFFVLIILMVLLIVMEKIFYKKPEKNNIKEVENKPVEKEEDIMEDETDNDELIAILTAAVASCLNTSTYNLKIKSFKRIKDTAPAWNRISRTEQVSNNL